MPPVEILTLVTPPEHWRTNTDGRACSVLYMVPRPQLKSLQVQLERTRNYLPNKFEFAVLKVSHLFLYIFIAYFASSYTWAADLIWTDSSTGQILRGTADGVSAANVLFDRADYPGSPSEVTPFGLTMDDNYIYWSDATTGQILRGASDGSGLATVLFGIADYPGSPSSISPGGLSVDDGHVYCADNASGEILRGAKDGSGTAATLFNITDYPDTPADIYPWDVAVNEGSIYWTDSDTSQVLRGSINGSGTATLLFASDPDRVNLGLAIDESHVYWADIENVDLMGRILRGNVDGTGMSAVLFDQNDYPGSPTNNVPIGVAVEGANLYWTDNVTRQILQGTANGSGTPSVLFDISDYPGSPTEISPSFLVVVPANLNADFDGDGDVDGADFLKWQRGGSPNPLSSQDLVLWQSQYGTSPLLSTIVAVPEPTTVIALLMAMTSLLTRSRLVAFLA